MERKLTTEEQEILKALTTSGHEWHRPLDVGGHSRSHHSRTLARLTKLGLVQKKQRSARGLRGSFIYAITEEGKQYV